MTASPPDPTIARYHLIFFQAGDDALTGTLCVRAKLLNQYVSTPSDSLRLTFGSLSRRRCAAPISCSWICYRCRSFGIIPDYAKSAATLLMLGVDEFTCPRSPSLDRWMRIEPLKRATIVSDST